MEDLEASDGVYYGSVDDEFSGTERAHDVHLNMAKLHCKRKIVSSAQRTSITISIQLKI